MKYLGIAAIRFYQKHLRHFHNRKCIYTPTCSDYGILAIEKYGFFKGCYVTYLRIRRCNGAKYKGGEDWL
ncbi:MAG TPA: membrane protein insertion efficiency factor YidD [bacterium]|nr:membrane protein insertion efficiency factor YidD [bacterium]HPS30624.1 membrane protein insertion efficiency factor YidD [bacterium]